MNRRKFIESSAVIGTSTFIVPSASGNQRNSAANKKKKLWLLLSNINNASIPLVIPSIAWMAKEMQVDFECYLEADRDGRLFARTGSTVLGGKHHQQFNYLNAIYDVEYIIIGEAPLFRSSIEVFGKPILAESHSVSDVYQQILQKSKIRFNGDIIFAGQFENTEDMELQDVLDGQAKRKAQMEISPYLYPEIYFRKALAFPASEASKAKQKFSGAKANSLFLNHNEKQLVNATYAGLNEIDSLKSNDDYGTISLRIAERWKSQARALAFGDPAAILSQLAKLCREDRVSIYGQKESIRAADVQVTAYTEAKSSVADAVNRLAAEIGNKVIVGRQTGDGDLFHWSKGGVCIQIMDPNRPAFPIVDSIPHVWVKTGKTFFEEEPDDATLEKYADEGKVLGTLMWHSGEMAHNEAMLNLFELVNFTGIKMGMGVHAARYETAPQLWELLNIPKASGGVKSLIEPVLHSGGMGVLAEINCPAADLNNHCKESLSRIKKIAGDEASPKGYYAFMDSDYKTLTEIAPQAYDAIANNGLEYVISSAMPGRNSVLYQKNNFKVINQTPRSICSASPFVRVTTVEDFREAGIIRPGWVIGTLDAPVIVFNQYVWRHGSRFMEIVDYMTGNKGIVNVLPHTIARYAGILQKKGYLPA